MIDRFSKSRIRESHQFIILREVIAVEFIDWAGKTHTVERTVASEPTGYGSGMGVLGILNHAKQRSADIYLPPHQSLRFRVVHNRLVSDDVVDRLVKRLKQEDAIDQYVVKLECRQRIEKYGPKLGGELNRRHPF